MLLASVASARASHQSRKSIKRVQAYGTVTCFLSTFLTVTDRKNKYFAWSGRGSGHGRDPEDLRRVAVQGRALQDSPPLGAGHRRTGRPGDAREVRHQQRSVLKTFLGRINASLLLDKIRFIFGPTSGLGRSKV
jgi:hypothetical protein